jgi:hypothetical protein
MSLIPSTGHAGLTLDRVRSALAPLKAALDERDGWELLAAAHERKEVEKMASKPAITGGGGRKGGARSIGMGGSDLKIGPRNPTRVPVKIPRSIRDQVVWTVQKINGTSFSTSTSAITEQNTFVTLGTLLQVANWTALFDQYCIVAFSVSMEVNLPPGGTAAFGQVYTAIDFDNVAALGTISTIESYATCKVQNLRVASVIKRSCRPCVASSVGPSTLGGVEKLWIDCAYTAVPHYGLRSIFSITGAALTVVPVIEMVVAFRSNI